MSRKIGFKSVESDKATLYDGTLIMTRDGDDLLRNYHEAVYDLFTTGSVDKNNKVGGFVKQAYNKLEERSFATLERVIKDTAQYFSSDNSDSDYIEYLISKQLFSWQKDLIIDLSKRITLLCGRRAGKSYGLSGMAVNHCRTGSDTINNYKKPRRVAIIGLTKEKCADVFWLPIINFANSTKMKYKEDSSKYQITFENGATINLFGNNSKAEREKIRGTEYSLIIIDEAQSQHSLEYLVTDILEPIIVGRDSQIVLSGTGSLTGYGKWADVTTGDEASSWKHYTATMEQNPTIPNHEDALRRVLEEKGWTVDNITYQREYLAKNVIDTTRIVFHTIHYYEDVPEDFIATGAIVGVDYGFSDYNAFAAVVYNNERFYLVDERKFNKASVTDIVNVAREINDFILKNYKVEPIFVADNSDQSISREIYNQGIKIYNAYKTDTQMQISRLKEWLENATILVKKNGFTDNESKQTVWKWDEEKKCVIYEIDDDYYHPDILHALRYAINYIRTRNKR